MRGSARKLEKVLDRTNGLALRIEVGSVERGPAGSRERMHLESVPDV